MDIEEIFEYARENGFTVFSDAVEKFEENGSVYIPTQDRRIELYMQRHYSFSDKKSEYKVTINWSAVGEKDIEFTKEFANNMQIAVKIGEMLETEIIPNIYEIFKAVQARKQEKLDGMISMVDFQNNNCGRCKFADKEKVGSGEPCCTFSGMLDISEDGNVCYSRKE